MDSFREVIGELDLEYWLERESIPVRLSPGRSGMQMNIRTCPHCGDTRYRVYLNQETGVGNCFVCGEGFNKGKFVHAYLGGMAGGRHTWGDTFAHVKECLREQGWRPKRKVSVAVNEESAKLPFSFELPTAEGRNLQYLENRGISGEVAKYFHLRFCEFGFWRFTGEDGRKVNQHFNDRIIIPVYDLDGDFKTFQGRDITGQKDKRYLFPKGLPGTGRYLLNGHNALRSKRVCMGEGAFDVMAIHIAFSEEPSLRGVTPIGSFGKHLSAGASDADDQLGRLIQLKAHGLEEVTIMWDGEWKALISALDAASIIQRTLNLKVRIAKLPKDRDPNEVTAQEVREAFWAAKPYTPALDVTWRLRNPFTGC
jgi:DNA primase